MSRRPPKQIELATDRLPWEQQPEEPPGAYAKFLGYRDRPLPRPSLQVYAKDCGSAHVTLRTHSSIFAWTARLAAWDRHLAERVEHVTAELVADHAIEHVKTTAEHVGKLNQIVTSELDKLLHASRTTVECIVPPRTLLQMIQMILVMSHQRTDEDMPTTGACVDLSRLSDEELRMAYTLAAKTTDPAESS